MTFWGCVLKPGQKSPAKLSESDVLHLSQACLHQPKAGKNYLQVQREGKVYSVACLEKDKREHETFDLFFDGNETTFVSKGDSEIHLMGYIEPMDDGMEDSEEEEQPVAAKNSPKVSPKASPKVSPSPKIEAKSSPKVEAKSPKVDAKSPKVSPKVAPAPPPEDDDDDEEGEEEELEGEEEEELLDEDEDEEEEEEDDKEQAKAVSAQLAKRKAAASKPEASPAKKPKNEPVATSSGSPVAGTADYIQKLVKYLKDNGAINIGLLGSKVPRPNGVPKMKAILEQNKDKFAVAGDKVSAK